MNTGKLIIILISTCFSTFCFLIKSVTADPLLVFVSILPQQYFVQQIGKDQVQVQVMVLPGASPATYEPKPSQMTALAKSKIYFSIGVPFENVWLKKIAATNPNMRLVSMDHGICKLSMATVHHHADIKHVETKIQHEQPPTHNIQDPHIWMSPPLVMIQARTVLTALQTADPAHSDFYETNYKNFLGNLADLDAQIRKLLANFKGKSFIVFHPSWGYYAHTYGLKQITIEIEGKEPKPSQLQSLIRKAKNEKIRVIFTQPQFSSKTARLIAKSIEGAVIPADPLAGDWASNLLNQTRKFAEAFQ